MTEDLHELQRRSHDFFWGGLGPPGRFSVISTSRPVSVGRGVEAEFSVVSISGPSSLGGGGVVGPFSQKGTNNGKDILKN